MITIAFITGRAQPRLDWLLDSLEAQVQPDDRLELVLVDRLGRSAEELCARLSPAAPLEHEHGIPVAQNALPRPWLTNVIEVEPKPNPWQGKHRITSVDWWAKSNAINTALVYCQTDYIAFVDDACRLSPTWLDAVRMGDVARKSVLAGAYEKLENGSVVADHREQACPNGKRNCGGGWLYGCTYALPLEWALAVNGAEEGCDGMGTEDYIFGLMLSNRGYRIDYVPSMKVTQDRGEVATVNRTAGIRRTDKGVSPNDKSHAALARFGSRSRTEFTPDLRELRIGVSEFPDGWQERKRPWPMPDPDARDWYDGQPIREMT